jgi:hypothetical protein
LTLNPDPELLPYLIPDPEFGFPDLDETFSLLLDTITDPI